MNPTRFTTWLRQSKRGDQMTYHIGLLMADRQFIGNWTGTHKQVDDIGKAAFAAHESKRVMLFQRRLAPGQCEYFATRV